MPAFTYTHRVFTLTEIIFWGLLLGGSTGLAAAATATRQAGVPPAAWAILWVTVVALWGVAAGFLYRKWKWGTSLKYTLAPPGIVIAWDDPRWAVRPEAVEAEIRSALEKLTPSYPQAEKALARCVVWFREPTWLMHGAAVSRTVTGLQDGELLMVGWREDLSTSALQHELAHRVLQLQGGDPPEAQAHEILAKLGL